mmetsp:Transcript_3121/g.8891  ORF Transcript_3121/g.8891 Transcript_3121/m.8891 type:complete len:474 (+) Transcript_3121:1512-2933(+)
MWYNLLNLQATFRYHAVSLTLTTPDLLLPRLGLQSGPVLIPSLYCLTPAAHQPLAVRASLLLHAGPCHAQPANRNGLGRRVEDDGVLCPGRIQLVALVITDIEHGRAKLRHLLVAGNGIAPRRTAAMRSPRLLLALAAAAPPHSLRTLGLEAILRLPVPAHENGARALRKEDGAPIGVVVGTVVVVACGQTAVYLGRTLLRLALRNALEADSLVLLVLHPERAPRHLVKLVALVWEGRPVVVHHVGQGMDNFHLKLLAAEAHLAGRATARSNQVLHHFAGLQAQPRLAEPVANDVARRGAERHGREVRAVVLAVRRYVVVERVQDARELVDQDGPAAAQRARGQDRRQLADEPAAVVVQELPAEGLVRDALVHEVRIVARALQVVDGDVELVLILELVVPVRVLVLQLPDLELEAEPEQRAVHHVAHDERRREEQQQRRVGEGVVGRAQHHLHSKEEVDDAVDLDGEHHVVLG